ncbi:MAG: helix-turn-helix transcriptional regulator [Phycisphaerae bacterium]|jgi:plasmid maintenance system antidote protein VapI
MSKKPKQVDLSGQLRAAFAESGLSRFELARRAGVSYAIVHRWVGGDRDITIGTASKLAGVLGLELRPVKRARK